MAVASDRRKCPVCGGAGRVLPRYSSVGLDRCERCGLIFLGRPVAEDIRGRYLSDEYVDAHVDHFNEDRAFKHIAKQRTRWLARRIAPGTLLEIGPGRGFFLDAARHAGFDPVGVEPSPVLAARAVSEFGVRVECGFLDEVNLPRRYFDAICMFHVFEHVENPIDTLTFLGELVKDAGLLLIEVPNIASAMAKRRGDRWAAVQPVELHISHFVPETLRRVVDRAGLQIVGLDTVAPWHYTPPRQRLRLRSLMGYLYRAASLRTLYSTHPSGFDNLRVIAKRRPAPT